MGLSLGQQWRDKASPSANPSARFGSKHLSSTLGSPLGSKPRVNLSERFDLLQRLANHTDETFENTVQYCDVMQFQQHHRFARILCDDASPSAKHANYSTVSRQTEAAHERCQQGDYS
jgi:hypothetical protein